MQDNSDKSAYLRDFKAKLLILAKPSIWGTAIFLSAIGLVIREYWFNPNMFTYNQNQDASALQSDGANLSSEERAIAAELDSLPALLSDVELGNIPAIAPLPPLPSESNNSESVLEAINQQLSSDSAESNPEMDTLNNSSPSMGRNPFLAEAEKLLKSGTFNVNDQPLGIQPLPTTSQTAGTAATSSAAGNGANETANTPSPDGETLSLIPLSELSNLSIPSVNDSLKPMNGLEATPVGGVMQVPPGNRLPNQNFAPNPGLNPVNGVQPTVPVQNNFDSIPELPTGVESSIPGAETGMNRNLSPAGSIQPPSADIVNQMSPVVADSNGNLIWRSPAEQMQPNSSNMGELSQQDLQILEQIRNSGGLDF